MENKPKTSHKSGLTRFSHRARNNWKQVEENGK